jgi:putative ABC transport system permease protein
MTGPIATTLALRLLRRAYRAGELRVLAAAVAVAVAAVSAVALFTDRVERALVLQGAELLGADRVVVADHPIPDAYRAQARTLGLTSADTLSFASMVMGPERGHLAQIKAVGQGYPLRGRVVTAPVEAGTGGVPAPGTVWLEPRLARALGLAPGDTLAVGDSTLRVAARLEVEPDRGGDLFSIAPRLMMNLADIPATGLVQDYSRVRYRLLVAGEPAAVAVFEDLVRPRLSRGETLQGVEDARPEVRTALTRARQFLGLASLVAVLLAAVAMLLAARRYADRHLDESAVLRCLGASQRLIVRLLLVQVLVLGLLAGLAGALLGLAAHQALVALLGQAVSGSLPAPSAWPLAFALGVGLVTLLAFALPPVLRLRHTPALRVLRRDAGALPPLGWTTYGLGVALLVALMFWQAGEWRLGLYVVGGSLATLALLGLAGLALVRALGGLRRRVGVSWRFGLANITRRPASSALQVAGFGLGVMALLLLTLVRADLFREWQGRLPPDTPNRFIINIQPDQVEPVRAFLTARGLEAPGLYPMIRGRLVAIHGRPVAPADFPEGRPRRLVAREFNLSHALQRPAHNRLVTGSWWPRGEEALWSVEQGIAQTLGIAVGDRLTFRVAGRAVSGRVANLRAVDWDSFRVNFFVIGTPNLLEGYPTSFVTSFYLPREREALLDDLVRRFPNLTVIDVAAVMERVRAIMDRVALAMEYVFAFTVLAGVLVMWAAIGATHDERLRESALLRTLGGSRGQLRAGLAAELAALGLLAGLVGALGASVVARLVATQVLNLPYAGNPWLWLAGPLGGTVLVVTAGWLVLRRVVEAPPVAVLRQL